MIDPEIMKGSVAKVTSATRQLKMNATMRPNARQKMLWGTEEITEYLLRAG